MSLPQELDSPGAADSTDIRLPPTIGNVPGSKWSAVDAVPWGWGMALLIPLLAFVIYIVGATIPAIVDVEIEGTPPGAWGTVISAVLGYPFLLGGTFLLAWRMLIRGRGATWAQLGFQW